MKGRREGDGEREINKEARWNCKEECVPAGELFS